MLAPGANQYAAKDKGINLTGWTNETLNAVSK